MKIFVDSTDINQIKDLNAFGIIDGVTTNPSLIKKSGRNIFEIIEEICEEVSGPVSAEVISEDIDSMINEGIRLSEIADNVVVKIPFTKNGIKASAKLIDLGKKINVTLCFSPLQALIAAKIGVHYISPFVGRLDDIALNGMDLIERILDTYDNYDFGTEVIVASVRSINHLVDSARMGAHIATVSPAIIYQMFDHPLTENGLKIFAKDWNDTKQSIL